jgi:hypothetical protein
VELVAKPASLIAGFAYFLIMAVGVDFLNGAPYRSLSLPVYIAGSCPIEAERLNYTPVQQRLLPGQGNTLGW